MKVWMRYVCTLTLTAALFLSVAACGNETEEPMDREAEEPVTETQQTETTEPTQEDFENMTPEEQSLALLRLELEREGAVCGACSIGPADDYAKSEGYPLIGYCAEWYPFVAAIPEETWITAAGQEMYCIVPRDENASVTVSEFLLDEETYTGVPGETLYTGGGEPIILIASDGETMPSLIVTVTAEDGTSVEYAPSLSMENGALYVPEGTAVYDFTLYNYEGPGSMGAEFIPEKLAGDWADFEVYDAEGNQYTMGLTFSEDGGFEMWYSEPMGDILLRYQGQYYEANGVGEAGQSGESNLYQYEVTAMEGEDFDSSAPAERHGAFAVEMWNEGDSIALIHRDGDPLFDGYDMENDISLVFDRAMG